MGKILIAAHKEYTFPDDPFYVPVEVNSVNHEKKICEVRDNEGKNISAENFTYCELTALYSYYYNNPDEDIYGLVHYRRYFKGTKSKENNLNGIIKEKEVTEILTKYDVIVPRRVNLVIETVQDHYIGGGNNPNDLVAVIKAMSEICPEYLKTLRKVLYGTTVFYFNMFIGKQEFVKNYVEFLFPLLERSKQYIDFSTYTKSEARALGYLGEVLLNVYVIKNKLHCRHLPLIQLEKENNLDIAKKYFKTKADRKKLIAEYKRITKKMFEEALKNK